MRHSSMQRPPMTSTAGWGRASTPQQGIVMVMTLILLTVMAVSTAVPARWPSRPPRPPCATAKRR